MIGSRRFPEMDGKDHAFRELFGGRKYSIDSYRSDFRKSDLDARWDRRYRLTEQI